MLKKKIHKCRSLLIYSVDRNSKYPVLIENPCCSSCSKYLISELFKSLCDINSLKFIWILNSKNHLLMFWKIYSCTEECFIKSLVKVFCYTKTLTCWLHLWSKAYLSTTKFLKREYRHLYCKISRLRSKSRLISKVFYLCTEDNSWCKVNDRYTCNFTDIRYCTAWTRINLNYINIIIIYNKLNVYKTDYIKRSCKFSGIINYYLLNLLCKTLCRIYRNTVTRMYTCTLNVLHNTRYKYIFSITNCVYLNLFTHKVFINKDWMILMITVYNRHILFNIIVRNSNLHSLSAENIWRSYKHRITKFVCCL